MTENDKNLTLRCRASQRRRRCQRLCRFNVIDLTSKFNYNILFIIIFVGLFSRTAAAQSSEVVIRSLTGSVLAFLSETPDSGPMISPAVGDILLAPVTILTDEQSFVVLQIDGCEIELAPGGSIVIPGPAGSNEQFFAEFSHASNQQP